MSRYRLPASDAAGRLIAYDKATLDRFAGVTRLLEAVGDVDDDGTLDLDLQGPGNGGNGGADDEHRGHLADAARAIFANKALSAEAKLKKLKLLLKIDDVPDDGDGADGDDVPREFRGGGPLEEEFR